MQTGPSVASNKFAFVALPGFAEDLAAVDGSGLLVDVACIEAGTGPEWQRCNWIAAAFFHLSCNFEATYEAEHGPAHSYAHPLNPPRYLYDYAWVNRIFMFLRKWAAGIAELNETDMFGPMPSPVIWLTHDVDYVRSTLPMRIKRFIRCVIGNDDRGTSLSRAIKYLFSPSVEFDTFEEYAALESDAGVQSVYFVHARREHKPRSFMQWLIDPGYNLNDPVIQKLLKALRGQPDRLGIHPGSRTWNNSAGILDERELLEDKATMPVRMVRQHWLKFSVVQTWKIQSLAGLSLDMTLGFNDRPGFRNSSALRFNPWDHENHAAVDIDAVPLVMMDAQFYEDRKLSDAERRFKICNWLNEVRFVAGEVSVLWHWRVLDRQYGWEDGYRAVLEMVSAGRRPDL